MYSETNRTSKMELLAKTVNDGKQLTIYAKRLMLDVWGSSKYASDYDKMKETPSFAYELIVDLKYFLIVLVYFIDP